MRWMQISDIHKNLIYNKTATLMQQDRLVAYIKKNDLKIDYLFLTGDFRDSGYLNPEKDLQKENLEGQINNVVDYIQEIAKALDVKEEQIFLVPGNHDLDRLKEDVVYVEEMKETYAKEHEEVLADDQQYLLKRFHFYEMIDQRIHPNESQVRAGHRFYVLKDCNILCLNSALTCTGTESKGDLFLGTNDIYQKLKKNR